MKNTTTLICQSCGMPMVAQEHFGTNRDRSQTREYCTYCYQNGEFCDHATFEETIQDYMQYPDLVPVEEGQKLTDEEKALNIRLHLITLKRWNVQHHTQEFYFRAVYHAVDYIRRHIEHPLELDMIAKEVGISRFHFHRIFKAIMNESTGEFIQRIRLEKAAFQLLTTRASLAEIALRTGYQSEQSLSRSFKKYYGITPSAYRRSPSDLSTPIRKEECRITVTPYFCELKPVEVICTKTGNPFNSSNAFTTAWDKLLAYTGLDGIPNQTNHYYCISRDVPTITQPDKQQIYVCVQTPAEIKCSGRIMKQTIQGGVYAVFPVKGSHRQLSDAYCYIYRYWLPNSEYEVRDYNKFEKFLTNPAYIKEEENITEIYIPVKKRFTGGVR